MKKVFILGGLTVSVSANYLGVVSGIWKDDRNSHNKFRVFISTELGKTSFTFYDSVQNYCDGVNDLDESGLKGALECFLSDASCYDSSIDFVDFCKEFGYESIDDYSRARKAYNGCRQASKAAARVFGGHQSEVWDELTEC